MLPCYAPVNSLFGLRQKHQQSTGTLRQNAVFHHCPRRSRQLFPVNFPVLGNGPWNIRAVRNTAATCRAPWGKPAARAIAPYVETMPRGICRMAAAIFALRCTDSELVCKFVTSPLI